MTARETASTINDAELTELYDDLDRYEELQGEMNERAIDLTRRAARAEAALREVLGHLYPITRANDPTPLGYQAVHPIRPADYQRWTKVLENQDPS